ncbi:MAG: HD domain-containing protein [Oscillospiraceae bacterium]|nr:HD domain-containing protein [Oscillospiraceae bacterium]
MIIVPVEKLIEGMVLARDVASTSATEYRTLLMRGTYLTDEMIAMLRQKGIKSVNIIGDEINNTFQKVQDMAPVAGQAVADTPAEPVEQPVEVDLSEIPDSELTKEQIKNKHIGKALTELNSIFDEDGGAEIKELSQAAVKKVNHIADDILVDIANDSTYLGNQMIALQNYDDYTYKHCLRVSMLATSVAHELGLSDAEIKEVIVSALLHDIGKSSIDHDIIIKPSKLTEAEFEEIKRHPHIGYNILKNNGSFSSNVMAGVLFHHEKFDGSGYPTGIRGKETPLIARIIAVCDVFDALTSNRPYRRPWSVGEAEEYILGGSNTHFDYEVASAFMRAFNPYPVGTMVSLSNGRYGVVIKQNQNVLRPVVRIQGEMSGEEIDLANDYRFLSTMVVGVYGGAYTGITEDTLR